MVQSLSQKDDGVELGSSAGRPLLSLFGVPSRFSVVFRNFDPRFLFFSRIRCWTGTAVVFIANHLRWLRTWNCRSPGR